LRGEICLGAEAYGDPARASMMEGFSCANCFDIAGDAKIMRVVRNLSFRLDQLLAAESMLYGDPADVEVVKESMMRSPYIANRRSHSFQNSFAITEEKVSHFFLKDLGDVIQSVQSTFWCVPSPNQSLQDLIASRVINLNEVPPSQQAAC